MSSVDSRLFARYSLTLASLSLRMASLVLLGSRRLPGLMRSSSSRLADLPTRCRSWSDEAFSGFPSRMSSRKSLTFSIASVLIRGRGPLRWSSQLSITLKPSINSALLKSSKKSLGISSPSSLAGSSIYRLQKLKPTNLLSIREMSLKLRPINISLLCYTRIIIRYQLCLLCCLFNSRKKDQPTFITN